MVPLTVAPGDAALGTETAAATSASVAVTLSVAVSHCVTFGAGAHTL
jgi:hypothetical protein